MAKVRTTIAPGLTSDDFVQTGGACAQMSTDGTLAGNSDAKVPTEKAVKTYVDAHGGGSGTVTSVGVSGGSTGLTTSGGPVTSSGTITLAGTLDNGYGGTGLTSYTLGDLLYANSTPALAKLAGNTSSTKKFLSQTGTGSVSAAPAWGTLAASDVGLGSVENTALSTWAGTANITTLGTVATGTWGATAIAVNKGGTGATDAATARTNLGFSTAAVQPVLYVPIHAAANSTLTWSSMPSAETILNASSSRIQKLDLTNYTSVRLIAKVNTAGASGAKLIARYNTSGSVSTTVSGNWTSDLGTSEVSVTFGTSTGMFDSGWISIASGAKGDYHIAIVGSGGDGSASPAFGGLQLQFR